MKINKTMILAAALLAVAVASKAQPPIKGGQCVLATQKGEFNCTHLGLITVADIYAKGWRVVATYLRGSADNNVPILIIEEQKP